ncbi:MAG: glutamine-hydrolyzing carbamoyl-phosphate synthase small subunit [Saprospiraceae bacterium]|nr:glutamine-hydrolyzing carbamoyl-phosphate synthase small subunit [Saprospiraceae bacterium]
MLPTNDNTVLLLSDKTVFYGKSIGYKGQAAGEVCFNTGMTGYQEIFTDPSYSGQLMLMTNVHIGNYGCHTQEKESSKIQINGLICRNFSNHFSRLSTDLSLEEYLTLNKIVVIYDVDTRALVHHVRNKGAMNAIISNDGTDVEILKKQLASVPDMLGLELASRVSTTAFYDYGNIDSNINLAVIDYGIKTSILKQLALRDFNIRVFPAKTTYQEIEKWNPHAFFLSNGPGDPSSMDYAKELSVKILESEKPTFGICLGHQILGLSMGIDSHKMFQGHRGSNHPVKNLLTGRGEITAQNHGFSLKMEDLEKRKSDVILTHINLNDKSVEGIMHKTKPVFSVQYHPEAGPGPHDSRYLFNRFSDLINKVYGFSKQEILAKHE